MDPRDTDLEELAGAVFAARMLLAETLALVLLPSMKWRQVLDVIERAQADRLSRLSKETDEDEPFVDGAIDAHNEVVGFVREICEIVEKRWRGKKR